MSGTGGVGGYTFAMPVAGVGSNYPAVSGYEQVSIDTERAQGAQPQTIAATAFQIAAIGAAISANAATATAGAATLNTLLGQITSEALTTAAGASYTLTLTNSTVAATSVVQASAYSKTNTIANALQVTSITPASGSVVIVVKNASGSALNGTITVQFMVNAS